MTNREGGGIAVLGSTGNIGKQVLQVLREQGDISRVKLLTANTNKVEILAQCKYYRPDAVFLHNSENNRELETDLNHSTIKVLPNEKALYNYISSEKIELLVLAIVGFAGLKPAIAAAKAQKRLAIANKESLVAGGHLLVPFIKRQQAQIIPVDSEHSGVYQSLRGEDINRIEKIILTASGGPFLHLEKEQWKKIKLEDALKHPTWNMGKKVSIDSASMMNKGLEVIEARWLFDLKPEQIEVVIHPQSALHSLVQFRDGIVKAQLSPPNMKSPIQYALYAPKRKQNRLTRFNFLDSFDLSFRPIDKEKFRNLALAYEALKKGGSMPAVLNAANEAAVRAVLQRKMRFYQIPMVIERAMYQMEWIAEPNYEELEEIHLTTIAKTEQIIKSID